MAKLGFLSQLNDELDKNFSYDYEINWDKKNHAVELAFLLEAENKDGLAIVDADDVESAENILYEDAVIFYNPQKSSVDAEEYLATIPYSEKGLSKEFIAAFVDFLQETADQGLDDLMDFLADPEAEEFSAKFDSDAFGEKTAALVETEFFKYPRY